MNMGQWLKQGPPDSRSGVGSVSANLSRGHTLRDPFKHRDVAALNIQHAEHRSAFGNHVFSPVFIKHKLIPLRTQDTQCPACLACPLEASASPVLTGTMWAGSTLNPRQPRRAFLEWPGT